MLVIHVKQVSFIYWLFYEFTGVYTGFPQSQTFQTNLEDLSRRPPDNYTNEIR
jgi:hypothetical protein